MELDGFNSAIVGILNDHERIVRPNENKNVALSQSGLYSIDASTSEGVLNASISGLSPQTQTISGSNEIVAISGQGTGEVTMTLGINNLPMDIEHKLIGAGYDEDTGAWYLDNKTRSPFSVVELISANNKGDAAHIALLKGQFYKQPQNLQTNNGSGSVNRATDSLQFKAINRHSDDRVIQSGVDSNVSFKLDKFRNSVFPGADLDTFKNEIDNEANNDGFNDINQVPVGPSSNN